MKPDRLKALLIAVRAKILSPKHWCQGFYATNKFGMPVPSNSKDACRFCLSGAANAVGMELGFSFDESVAGLDSCFPGHNAPIFNDRHTHAEVIAYLDEQIAKAKQ